MNCLGKDDQALRNQTSLRFVGRWHCTEAFAVTTTPGAHFYLAYQGNDAVLHFDTQWLSRFRPHLWICVDDGPYVEAPVDRHLRVHAQTAGNHIVKVIFKSAVEVEHRWHMPLQSAICFLGFDAQAPGVLPESKKMLVEFVGDSITEGVLVDAALGSSYFDRPYQDDSTATYAWLTAQALGWEPVIMGYGAVGVTRGGNGGVPAAAKAYPYCFADTPITYGDVSRVIINHGANDRASSPAAFCAGYTELLEVISAHHPQAAITVVQPFCGVFAEELQTVIQNFRANHSQSIELILTEGWIPLEPLHPDREGHRKVAERLVSLLRPNNI